MKRNRSVPDAAVVPVLVYPDVRAAVEWLVSVFGLVERMHIPPNHRVQLRFGESAVIVAERGAPGPAGVLIRVDDAGAVLERAVAAGAVVLDELHDWEYGERQATIQDPGGHRWTVSETLFDAEPESWGGITVSP
jgi:uncharacterized glyoxalase superfamily protein PhnB